jgi:drug/metabolite transporter (DMT)-like permease
MEKERWLVGLCYAMVYLVWGSTYFFIRAAVQTVPPALVVGLRFLAGALILALIGLKGGAAAGRSGWREWAGSAATGVLLLLLGNGLITAAERTVPSYLASLIVSAMPFIVAGFNYLLYREKLSWLRLGGVLVGVAGIGALLYSGPRAAASAAGGGFGSGLLVAVAGALAWGLGTATARRMPKLPNVFRATAVQMLAAGVAALAIALAQDPRALSGLAQASAWSLFGVGYLAVLGSLTLVAYNYLLAREPSFRVSSYSLVNPAIAVGLGLAAGEAATPYLGWGLPLVLAGLALMLYGDALRARWSAGGRPDR